MMTNASTPVGRTALVFAPAGHPDASILIQALQGAAIGAVLATRASQGLSLLCNRPTQVQPAVVIILGGLPGLSGPAIGKAVRSLPGLGEMPLIVVGEAPLDLPRCTVLTPPIDAASICRLAAVDPEAWPPPIAAKQVPLSAAVAEVVLVVDDSSVIRLITSTQARFCGHPVETCADGKEALVRIAAGGVALILVNCRLSHLDSFETSQEIRRGEAGTDRHLPIIALTVDTSAECRQRCLQSGMDDCLILPLDQDHLLAAIRAWYPTGPAAAAVLTPGPLQRIDLQVPGAAQEIVALFRHDLKRVQEDLPRLLADADVRPLVAAMHKLKGASGSIGAIELARACATLEQSARQGDLASDHTEGKAMLAAINRLDERLNTLCTPNSHGIQWHFQS